MKYTPRRITKNVNISRTSPLREFFILALGISCFFVAAYFILGIALDYVAPRIPLPMEDRLSSFFAPTYKEEDNTSPAAKKLQKLLEQLVSSGNYKEKDYHIHLVPSPTVNALALPGRHIVVFSGLLAKVQSENELAMILGHELGHFRNKDHLRGLGRGLVLLFLSVMAFGLDSQIPGILQSALINTEMQFSRKQEHEADAIGLELIRNMYGHAGGATDFFRRLSEEEKMGRFYYLFTTHPYPIDRVRKIESLIREKKYPVLDTVPLVTIRGGSEITFHFESQLQHYL